MDELKRSATSYAASGVDTDLVEDGLARLVRRVKGTWPASGVGRVALDIGFYANVVDLGGGQGLAITTDGVGSKVLIAELLGRYDTIGVDCVAMNVNDLLCVGATPLTLVDYVALEQADPDVLDQVAIGLTEGARLAGVSIAGGEMAVLPEIIRGAHGGSGLDLAATAVGTVALDRIIVGADVQAGDALVGVESNGIHSNGLTLARRVLLSEAELGLDAEFGNLVGGSWGGETAPRGEGDGPWTLGDELLRPTHIYVRETLALLQAGVPVRAMMHITGDGFLNLRRVQAEVGFVIDGLPPAPSIFGLIQRHGNVGTAEMYRVFNMGVGFCYVVPPASVTDVISAAAAEGKQAWLLGQAVADTERHIEVRPAGLASKGKRFVAAT